MGENQWMSSITGACRGDNCGHSIAGTPALSWGAKKQEEGIVWRKVGLMQSHLLRCLGIISLNLRIVFWFHVQVTGDWIFVRSMEFPGSLNRWDRYHIIPELAVYTTYIPLVVLANWVIIWYRSHLLREPGNSIEKMGGNFTFFSAFLGVMKSFRYETRAILVGGLCSILY